MKAKMGGLLVTFIASFLLLGFGLEPLDAVQAARAGEQTPEEQIRQATLGFYVAMNSMFKGDLEPMKKVWSHTTNVTNMDPYGGRGVGWNAVYQAYQRRARLNVGGRVTPDQVLVTVGDDLGYSVCVEHGQTRGPEGTLIHFDERATNIFRRENGKWKMVHHHSDPIATGSLARATN